MRAPVASGIAKWVYRYMAQSVYPWNERFARGLPDDSPFAPREAVAGRDARTLAREVLGMTQEEFAIAFRGSPMKRAKLWDLKRNAAVVLGNVGTVEDVTVLQQALADPEPLARAHAAWALRRLRNGEHSALSTGAGGRDTDAVAVLADDTVVPTLGSGT